MGTRQPLHSACSCELNWRAFGGGVSYLGVGCPGLGTRRRLTARPWGVRPAPATHWLWVQGLSAWGPVTNPTARALVSSLCNVLGRHEGIRGGGHLLTDCGASGAGRSPTPDRPSFERAAGARYPVTVGAGGVGVGTRHPPHSTRSCELALPAVEAARGRPRGGASCLGVGRPEFGALWRPTGRPRGMRPGPASH